MRARVFLILTMVAACAREPGNTDRARQSRTDFSTGTHLVLLGTGTPNPDPDRLGPSVAIVSENRSYLVDAGTGVVRRAAAAAREGFASLEPAELRRVFLTHLHSDHTLGLPDLILTPWVLERGRPLEVYGPPGTADMVEHILAAWEGDIRNRVDGIQPSDTVGYRVSVTEIEPGLVLDDGTVRVTAFSVTHTGWEHAFGYRFDTAERSIVVSGDTAPDERIAGICDGCDILLHEVYSEAGFRGHEPDWRTYHSQAHTSSSELARIASSARPGLLVLYHQLLWGEDPESLLAEIRSGYSGEVAFGRDLDVY